MTGRIHDRYLLKLFLRIFFYSVLAFAVIYITVDVFEEIDNFIDHSAGVFLVAKYYFFSLPFILTYIVPLSLLLATIFSMGILGRRNEITAFVASGISLVRVAAPILITAALVSLGSTFFNDTVVSKANIRHKDIMRYEIENGTRSNPMLKENLHYLGDNGYVYLATRYNHRTQSLHEVVVQRFDGSTLVRRVDAKRAVWNGEDWVFYQGFDRVFDGDNESVASFDQLIVPELKEPPELFAKEEVDEENMTAKELWEYVKRVRHSGGNVERYLTDFYFKFSYPLAGAIFVLLGIALASGKRKQSMAAGFGWSLLTAFVYYGVLRVGQTLGYNGVLPPFLAAQLGNIIFLFVGFGLITRANQ